ncbi:MAG: hypothetical protein EOO60_13250 [Hymenobacter sp.]|nr:MAG: hypothetical protein EOO60_13250 [Hymenobacter sp.]
MEYNGIIYRIVVLDYREVYFEKQVRCLWLRRWQRLPTNHLTVEQAWKWYEEHVVNPSGWTVVLHPYR